MKSAVVFISFIFISTLCSAQVLTNANEAFDQAAKTNKPVLLVFSGSDWCQQCIRFDKTILSDSAFTGFRDKYLVLLKADFPQRKKLSPEQVKQNEELAELFNPEGQFPCLLLLSSDKKIIARLTYNHQTASEFISELNPHL